MDEFDYEEKKDDGSQLNTQDITDIDLEKVIDQDTITHQAAREAELEDLRRQRINLLRKAEEIEQKYSGDNTSITGLWEKAIEEVANIYNQKGNTAKLKKRSFGILRKIGIDIYSIQANSMLKSAQQKAEKIKNKLDYIHEKLNSEAREKGLAVTLKEQREIAVSIANALVSSKRAIKEYIGYISEKKSDLQDLREIAKQNPEVDYNGDIAYIMDKIEELKSERASFENDARELGNKLQVYDAKIKTNNAIVSAINLVYSKGLIAYSDLQSEIDIAREFVNTGRFMEEGIGKTMEDLEEAVNATGGVIGMEKTLGDALVKSTRIVTKKMNGITSQLSNKNYLNEIKKQSNEDQHFFNVNLDEKIAEYATENFK